MSKFFKTFHLQTPLLPAPFARTPRALFLNSYFSVSILRPELHSAGSAGVKTSLLLSGAVSVVQLFVSLRCKRHRQHRRGQTEQPGQGDSDTAPPRSPPLLKSSWGLGSHQRHLGIQRCLNTSLQLTSNWLLSVRAYVNDKHWQMKRSTAKGL